MMLDSPEEGQVVLEGPGVELWMRGNNLNVPLFERVRFIYSLEVILSKTNEKFLWLHAGGERCSEGSARSL